MTKRPPASQAPKDSPQSKSQRAVKSSRKTLDGNEQGYKNSLKVYVGDLLAYPGKQKRLEGDLELEEVSENIVQGMTKPKKQARFDLTLDSAPGDICVSGYLKVSWVGECRRCLNPVSGDLVTKIKESFQRDFKESETYPIMESEIDLYPMLAEATILTLPSLPLCSEDCKGPLPEIFVEEEKSTDKRWDTLRDFKE